MIQSLSRSGGLLALCLLAGCAASYNPLTIDPATDLYATSSHLDPGGVLSFVTTTNPKQIPIVVLASEATSRPSLFEFKMREVLAQVGANRVLNESEFSSLVTDRAMPGIDNLSEMEMVRQFSAQVAPVLLVKIRYGVYGSINQAELIVIDGRDGRTLLHVNHAPFIWTDPETETLFPVLNEMRRWFKASSKEPQA